MNKFDLEIYKQRYETFRHLDRLRWYMLQLLIAVGSAFAIAIRVTSHAPEWWLYLTLSLALGFVSWASVSINNGIRSNGIILKKSADAIGDTGIPCTENPLKSSAHWLAFFIAGLSIVFLIFALIEVWKFYGAT